MAESENQNLLLKFHYDCCFDEADVIICKKCYKIHHYSCFKQQPNKSCCGLKLTKDNNLLNELPSGSRKESNIISNNIKIAILEDKVKKLMMENENLKQSVKGYEVYEELKNLDTTNLEKPALTFKNNLSPKAAQTHNLNNMDFSSIDVPKEHNFIDFLNKNRLKNKKYTIITEVRRDLFSMPEEVSLACCTGEDFHLTKGIGLLFRKKFKETDELKNVGCKVGEVVAIKDSKRFIFYLITKRDSFSKPTLESMFNCVVHLREYMIANEVVNLAIPKLGCGLDRLNWNDVKFLFQYVFDDLCVEITVCNV